jgi:hypothetical protein
MGFAARRLLLAPILGALLIASASPAAAQSPGERLFQEGREAMDAGKLDVACGKFDEAFRLENSIGPLLNLAECESRRGRLVLSLGLWKTGLARLPESDARRDIALLAVERLEKRVGRVTPLAPGAPAGSTVTLDGAPADVGKPVAVDPGEHTLMLVAGAGARTEQVRVAEGESRSVTLIIDAGQAGTPGPTSAPASPAATPPARDAAAPGSGLIVAGTISGAVGVAGLVTFGITGVLFLQKKSEAEEECPDAACPDQKTLRVTEDARTLGIVNAIALGVGVVGIGVGGALLWSGTREPSPPVTALVSVRARVGPGYLGLSGRF